jgi:LacI family transcriptional regulator
MQSRDILERRLGFDEIMNAHFLNLQALPSLETYGSAERAETIISSTLENNPDVAGIYFMSSEARVPLTILKALAPRSEAVKIAHERTPFTEDALRTGDLDGVITQDIGHLVRSAIRRLKGLIDQRQTLKSQEKIRIEILLRTNI